MRYPEFLKNGGTIGFIAPSFGCATEPYTTAFDNALKTFAGAGYSYVLGPNVYASDGIGISTYPDACAAEFNAYMASENCDVIISCGGGELMCEILPYVDFEALKAAKPKWFMGFSDNTNITFLLNTICDTASIYGPCASSFGMVPWHQSITDAFDVLKGEKLMLGGYDYWEKNPIKSEEVPLAGINATEPTKYILYDGKFPSQKLFVEGRLTGGCMDCLGNLLGTPFDHVKEFNARYASEGTLWVLEACDLGIFDIRRTLWRMRQAGWFDTATGFLIGRPVHHGEFSMGLDQYSAVVDVLGDMGLPIIMDLDIGHMSPQMPLIMGSHAVATAYEHSFNIEFKLI